MLCITFQVFREYACRFIIEASYNYSAISACVCHRKIKLNDVLIGDEGVVAGMNSDKENITQSDCSVSLDLGECDITSEGLHYLNKIPKHVNSILLQLNISSNSIGQEGATTLAKILKGNRTLLQLNVSYNPIGQGGAIALAEMLKENRTLHQLDVNTYMGELIKESRTLN